MSEHIATESLGPPVAQGKGQANNRKPVNRVSDRFRGTVPMALGAIFVTLFGFWKTFFTDLGNVDAAHLLHGWLATGWLVLVLVQATLAGNRKFKWHRILGWSSVPVFILIVVTSIYMLILMMSGTGWRVLPFEVAKIFGYSDVTALPLFIIVYTTAIVLRKDRHVHSRLISITLLAGLLPALARFYFGLLVLTGMAGADSMDQILNGLAFAMHPTYISIIVVLGAAIFVDWKNDRLRWPFPFAFIWMAVVYATFFPGLRSAWFDHVARAIAALA